MTGDLEDNIRKWLKDTIIDVVRDALPELKQLLRIPSEHESADAARLLRPRETAAALGISERHLHKLTQEGTIPCIRLGRIVRYSVEGLRGWIADHESNGSSCAASHGSASSQIQSRTSRSEIATAAPHRNLATSRIGTDKPAKNRRKTVAATKIRETESSPAKRVPRSASQSSSERPTKSDRNADSSPKGPSDFDKIAKRVGISSDGIPSVTYADLVRIAGIDANTLHGFLCFDRDFPEPAITRLRKFFLEQSTAHQPGQPKTLSKGLKEQPSNRPEVSSQSSNIRSVRQLFAERLKVPVEALPQLTNGDVMRIADVDIPTLHGWVYQRRELPAAAIEKLEQFFAAKLDLA